VFISSLQYLGMQRLQLRLDVVAEKVEQPPLRKWVGQGTSSLRSARQLAALIATLRAQQRLRA
jgi:hypothetical protein